MKLLKTGDFAAMQPAQRAGLSFRNPYSKRARQEKLGNVITEDVKFLLTAEVTNPATNEKNTNIYGVTVGKARFRVTEDEALTIDTNLAAGKKVVAVLKVEGAEQSNGTTINYFDLEDLKVEATQAATAATAAEQAS